ncbi:hypothetical protein UlMin_002905 [Ulmus minor]
MATGAAEMMFRCVFEGSISMHDMEIERRPYHKNCGCALHNLKGVGSDVCPHQRKISFPKKQTWSECSMSMASTSTFSSHNSPLTKFVSSHNGEDKDSSNGVK